jgi:hypothetical protein
MSEESHGLFHFGKKEEAPPPPTPEEHHGLFHLGEKKEAPPPPAPEHHGLFHLGKEETPPPPPQPSGLMAWLFHRAPVSPEPASPRRPQLFRHHSFRTALYILGLVLLLAWIVPGILPDALRFYSLAIGAALLLGGILLTGDWHPLSGMLGLRKVRVPTSAAGVAEVVAEHEAKAAIDKVTREDDEQPKETVAQRLAPWHWPWSAQAREVAQEQKAEEAKKFKHVGIFGKVLMGIMAVVMGYGANTILEKSPHSADLNTLTSYAHGTIILITIALVLFTIFTRIRTFRHHWLSPLGIVRRLIVFFIVTAAVAFAASLLTGNAALGQGYGELIGGLVGLLAVLV